MISYDTQLKAKVWGVMSLFAPAVVHENGDNPLRHEEILGPQGSGGYRDYGGALQKSYPASSGPRNPSQPILKKDVNGKPTPKIELAEPLDTRSHPFPKSQRKKDGMTHRQKLLTMRQESQH